MAHAPTIGGPRSPARTLSGLSDLSKDEWLSAAVRAPRAIVRRAIPDLRESPGSGSRRAA
jgi:hypothetical protein